MSSGPCSRVLNCVHKYPAIYTELNLLFEFLGLCFELEFSFYKRPQFVLSFDIQEATEILSAKKCQFWCGRCRMAFIGVS